MEESDTNEYINDQQRENNNEFVQHYMKNPFNKDTQKPVGTELVANLKHTKTQSTDEGQYTNRMQYCDIFCPDLKKFSELKHYGTEVLQKSLIVEDMPLSEHSEVRKGPPIGIEGEELAVFASAFKDKIKMSDYIADQFKTITTLSPTAPEDLTTKIPPLKKKKLTNKTLVLDLDNTLVCVLASQLFNPKEVFKGADVRDSSYIDVKKNIEIKIKVVIRPYAIEMLKQLSLYYEIGVFTAANKAYGDAVINVLDPEGVLIDFRLYRENCIRYNCSYIKDLRILGRDLASVIMVDDIIVSFSNQLENGIFIPPFFETETDSELGALWIFLRQITSATDVRVPIAAKYNLLFFYRMYTLEKKNP